MSTGKYLRKNLLNRIKEKINIVECPNSTIETKCHVFTGATEQGYGRINRKGKLILVHRYMYWYYFIKPLGTSWEEFSTSCSDLDVCHRCDNPSCCNPKHLFLGTQKRNMQDCMNKGRYVNNLKSINTKGENHGRHKLTNDQVKSIFYAKGTQENIAKKFGVVHSTVGKIKSKRSWKETTFNF